METKGIDYEQESKLVFEQLLKSTGINFERELESILKQLTAEPSSNSIEKERDFVPPFIGGNNIKLIIIGQDPTIRNVKQRKNIKCTLNLNKSRALTKYIEQICEGLGITIENVYATNVFKYFYENPPADTFDVLIKHLPPNLNLLKKELSVFPKVPVITLGEPILKLLTDGVHAKVRYYWGYDSKSRTSNGAFKFLHANENKLNRTFYPFCHQPSIRKQFYNDTIKEYTHFVKCISRI